MTWNLNNKLRNNNKTLKQREREDGNKFGHAWPYFAGESMYHFGSVNTTTEASAHQSCLSSSAGPLTQTGIATSSD